MADKLKALVTGASRGIGKATAEALLAEGYEVTGTSREPKTIPDNERIAGVKYLALDLSVPDSIDRLIRELKDIDILVNNAGVSQIGPVEEVTMEQVRDIFELNFFGVVRLIKGFLPGMRKRGRGWIINISSMAGRASVPYSAVYAATKSGLDAFSRCFRNEVARFGVKVVTVAPDYIRTTIPQKKNYKDDSLYIESIERVKKVRDGHIAKAPGPEVIARKVTQILKMKSPKPSYAVGGEAPKNAFLLKHLPESMAERVVRKKFNL